MAQVTLGNHAAVVVSLTEQDAVRRFYRDVLGCALTRSANDKDDFVLGRDFYLAVVYADEAVTLGKEDFLKATYLELRTGNVEEVQQQIQTAHRRFARWAKAGVWPRIHRAVLDELGSQGLIDWSRAIADAACVRAKKGAP